MIAIIDYNAGNLTSVKRAMDRLGRKSVITDDCSSIARAERIIFPGVGAAGRAMTDLKKKGLDRALIEAFNEKKPILGICLGTQIIMERSEENDTECLGIIRGKVKRFAVESSGLKVPHMGWNSVMLRRKHPLFQGVEPDSEFYFVHSYYPLPDDPDRVLGETDYIARFASALSAGNLAAMQFHPEKSGEPGLKILDNFCKWDGRDYVE
ncbi:MAG: imidazole glycerol phosphate synthase subunit HisH [Deltaproteobacteria bacterium]|nr:imidazole glycerol phosphate synthase subunit HisH [Deltaproteobacteria bacterium]